MQLLVELRLQQNINPVRQSCGHRRSPRRRVRLGGPQHRYTTQVRLQLHQQVVGRQRTIGIDLGQRKSTVLVHCLDDVARLEAGRLESRSDDVVLGGESGEAANDSGNGFRII